MAKQQQRLSVVQAEITNTEQYAQQLKINEPEAYQAEIKEINEKLISFRVEHLEILMAIYEKQNPAKFVDKKPALEAKLEYLRQGGNPAQWNYPNWKKLQESVKATKTEEKKPLETPKEPEVKDETKTEEDKK